MALVKVCGLTRIADLRLSLRCGADYVGAIVEIERSPRSVSREAAGRLLRCSEGRGVIVTEAADVEAVLALVRERPTRVSGVPRVLGPTRVSGAAGVGAIQLHGGQGPEVVAGLVAALSGGVEVWAVLAMPAEGASPPRAGHGSAVASDRRPCIADLIARSREFAQAGAAKIVLDSAVKGVSGGTGVPVNWELAAQVIGECPVPVLLAGGITAGNAREALAASGAAGLDVSSGVEARAGVKAAGKVRAVIGAARGEAVS